MITRRDFLKTSAASGVLLSTGMQAHAKQHIQAVMPDEKFAFESARKFPVYTEADVIVAGGSSAAIAAASAAAATGKKVFLITNLPYLGDDICGMFRYREEKPLFDAAILAQNIFKGKNFPNPLLVKTELENELLYNNITFLYSSFVTDVITAGNGDVAGIIIANRSGRQAVKAPVVIDATPDAAIAKMAGARFTPFVSGTTDFVFSTIGNNAAKTAPEIVSSRVLPAKINCAKGEFNIIEYHLRLNLPDNSYASLANAEQLARSLTWDKDIVDSSDLLFHIPSQHIVSAKRLSAIPESSADILPEAFLSDKKIWVLGASADIDRKIAAELFQPINAITVGACIGEIAAKKETKQPANCAVLRQRANDSNYGEIKELLHPLRPKSDIEWVDSPHGSLPVLGAFDVVVSGGGVSGAPAGISAARHGAKTLVLEYLHGLGGLGTFGMIGIYWDGYREGFTKEIDKGVKEMAPADHPRQDGYPGSWDALWKAEWYRSNLLKAGGEVWFGVMGCGALVENNKVKGVIVVTPCGRGVVLCNTVIDSSGSADIAIAAGAEYVYTGAKTVTVQGAGLPKYDPADYSNNSDWLFIDETDVLDVTRVFVQGKKKYPDAYDLGKMPQTRERRRMVGEYTVTVADIIQKRLFADTISYHVSSFDTHGTTIDPFFTLSPPMERHSIYDASVPFRSLLPKGLEGIIVTGLGVSAHRDAMPVIRMQSCLQSQGFSVGYVAALSAKDKLPLRKIDIQSVQKYLVKIGNLPESVITKKTQDIFNSKALAATSASVSDNYKGVEILLSMPDKSIPLLKKRISSTSDSDSKLIYASILSILGNGEYADVVADKIASEKVWDEGWHYTGMHQFGQSMSRLDAYIIALGNSGRKELLPVILSKAALLKPEDYYSHFRAVTLACEALGSNEAADSLYKLLNMSGMQGSHLPDLLTARNRVVPNTIDVSLRNKSLKEVHLARALYRCGDKEGLGRTLLTRYAQGLEGHYHRCAAQVLYGE